MCSGPWGHEESDMTKRLNNDDETWNMAFRRGSMKYFHMISDARKSTLEIDDYMVFKKLSFQKTIKKYSQPWQHNGSSMMVAM